MFLSLRIEGTVTFSYQHFLMLSLTLHDLGTRPQILRAALPGIDRLGWREVDMEAKTFNRRVHEINRNLAVLGRVELSPCTRLEGPSRRRRQGRRT